MNEKTYWHKYNKKVAGMLIGFLIAFAGMLGLIGLLAYILFQSLK